MTLYLMIGACVGTCSTRQPVRPMDTQLHVLGADGIFFCVGQTIEAEQGKSPRAGSRDQWSQLGSIGRQGCADTWQRCRAADRQDPLAQFTLEFHARGQLLADITALL